MLDPRSLRFPPPQLASPEGLLAIGGDLRSERLLAAYRRGIFPWYNSGQPILWWSPDPRTVLFPAALKISRSLRKTLRRGRFAVTMDSAFERVIRGCAAPREGEADGGTWITPEMRQAYCRLHELGHAHSVESWLGGTLAGGLYGVALGGVFFGESMFSRETDASKVALTCLARQIECWGYSLIDCQMRTAHLLSLGAVELPRAEFLARLAPALEIEGHPAPWRLELKPNEIA